MPELPEVETVLRTLESRIATLEITGITVRWPGVITGDIEEFCSRLMHQHFNGFMRRGKYLLFVMDDCILESQLRM